MKLLITGIDGFLGRNLRLHLSKRQATEIVPFTRQHRIEELPDLLEGVDAVVHLAGVNRPLDPAEFAIGNRDLSAHLANAIDRHVQRGGTAPLVVLASSIQAALDNPYGRSKREAEDIMRDLTRRLGSALHVLRLPNVFGKWARPHYNSVVATFCHQIARDLPVQIHDPDAALRLVYVDDVVALIEAILERRPTPVGEDGQAIVTPEYATTVGQLAQQLQAFRDSRNTLLIPRVGSGLLRALYATYVSYLPVDAFAYAVPSHADQRGVFVEMLKTSDSGQFSYLTAPPGVTRGGHYHHSKTEKFLVIKGQALFRFKHMATGETHELITRGDNPTVVETVPGWTHDITNIGQEDMLVMLWANEVFDRNRPDTHGCPLGPVTPSSIAT